MKRLGLLLCLALLAAACTPLRDLPGLPNGKRFIIAAEGNDALLGTYEETFHGNAAYAGSLLQLWSDSETPNRVLKITYPAGDSLPVGTYQVVGSEADVTNPTGQVIVTYVLAQGAFCTGCKPQPTPVADYYFEYLGTSGNVTITAAGAQLAGTFDLEVAKHSYHAHLEGEFQATAGR